MKINNYHQFSNAFEIVFCKSIFLIGIRWGSEVLLLKQAFSSVLVRPVLSPNHSAKAEFNETYLNDGYRATFSECSN